MIEKIFCRDVLERLLFPRSPVVIFIIIAVLSGVFAYLLTGRQIYAANWGLIDDHEVFSFLGPDLHLSVHDIWRSLIDKTEVGQLQARFRPTYYVLKIVEACIFGARVHFWYALNTVCFAIFLAAIWWTVARFAGGWLAGALTAAISLMPLWAYVWARLGPSEIMGAAFVGIMLFAADATLFGKRSWSRTLGAVVLAVSAVALAGLKETFLPLAAGGPAFVYGRAAIKRQLPTLVLVATSLVVMAGLLAISVVVWKELRATGNIDFYGRSAGAGATIKYAMIGILDGLLRTWWIWVLPIAFLRILNVVPDKPLKQWIAQSLGAFALYVFLIAMYAAQCGVYRMSFPYHSRYDFPAVLLVPLTFCLLACEVSRRLGNRFPMRTIQYAQLTASMFLIFALVTLNVGTPPALLSAEQKNIQATNAFFDELQRAIRDAKEAPEKPVILDAHGPRAFEAIASVRTYLTAFCVRNPVSVRFHQDPTFQGEFYASLQRSMTALETTDSGGLTALDKSLAARWKGCLSIGLDGPADPACTPFEISDD